MREAVASPEAGTLAGAGADVERARVGRQWVALIVVGVLFIGLYPVFSDDIYYQNMIIL